MDTKKHMLPSDLKRKRFIKVQATTNTHYGKSPSDRTINELLHNGMMILDKPSGPTSHQVVAWIKNILDITNVGHGGTLDPNPTGVLPVAFGDGTHALQSLLHSGKEYITLMKLHKACNETTITETVSQFVGEIYQVPPLRSAVKRRRRKRHIYYLDILEIKNTEVLFKVGCESGTYVRTLCVDIGKKLGCKAHMQDLRRTRVGSLIEQKAATLQDLKDAYVFFTEDNEEKELRKIIQPAEQLLVDLPKIVVRDSAVDALCHGANLAVPGVIELDAGITHNDLTAIMTQKGEGVALAHSKLSSEQILEKDTGICAELVRVLMKKGTYPSIWKKS